MMCIFRWNCKDGSSDHLTNVTVNMIHNIVYTLAVAVAGLSIRRRALIGLTKKVSDSIRLTCILYSSNCAYIYIYIGRLEIVANVRGVH